MKKFILFNLLIIASFTKINAQGVSKHALGLRLGNNGGFGGEISFQKKITQKNRLEANLGFRNNYNYNALKITGLYQWVWKIENGFNWYAGVGGGVSSLQLNNKYYNSSNTTSLFAAGNIGIEYNFNQAPIQLSLDYRPEFNFNSTYYNTLGNDIALGVRYKFN